MSIGPLDTKGVTFTTGNVTFPPAAVVPPKAIPADNRSESIDKLAAALSKAQSVIKSAVKDTTGQVGQQKVKYADLTSVWEACRAALTANELSVLQSPSADGPKVTVRTMLMHSSGQYVSGELTMTAAVNSPQAIGSAITYARRYALASMVGVAPDDDDGTAATKKP